MPDPLVDSPSPARAVAGFDRFAGFDGVLPTTEVTVLTVWLRDTCGSLFRALAAPSAHSADPSERSWRHVAAGLFGLNAEAFAELVPESVLLEAHRNVPVPAELASWAAAIGRMPSAAAGAALGRFGDQLALVAERLSPVSDRALRRQLHIFRADIAEVATDVSPVH